MKTTFARDMVSGIGGLLGRPASAGAVPEVSAEKIDQMRRLSQAAPPLGPHLTVMVVAKDKDVFSSGEVLRETSVALGESMSPSTLHRVLLHWSSTSS